MYGPMGRKTQSYVSESRWCRSSENSTSSIWSTSQIQLHLSLCYFNLCQSTGERRARRGRRWKNRADKHMTRGVVSSCVGLGVGGVGGASVKGACGKSRLVVKGKGKVSNDRMWLGGWCCSLHRSAQWVCFRNVLVGGHESCLGAGAASSLNPHQDRESGATTRRGVLTGSGSEVHF